MIEFALFAPILALMAVGISDMAMGYSTKLQVEQAVYRALEKVTIGTDRTDFDYLRAEAAAADGDGGIQASDVTVDKWLECDGTRQADFNGACTPAQDTARYVTVTVNWRYIPYFDYSPWFDDDDDGQDENGAPIVASASVRFQ